MKDLRSVACLACRQPALAVDEAGAAIDALGRNLLAAPDVLETARNEARYWVEHWPFCAECYREISPEG
jgi:hypothetical protein